MSQLIPGVSCFSRSASYAKRGLFKLAKKTVEAAKAPQAVFERGQKRRTRKTVRAPVLRKSLVPGTVVVLLAGRFRGKRVVFLKQLASGLLLVAGPHRINGVPLRRVNQAYVAATQTKVDVASVLVPAHINDLYFKHEKTDAAKNTADALLSTATKKPIDPKRIVDQKSVDSMLIAAIAKVPAMKAYLASKFSLSKGQYPHAIKL